jgi:ribonuclease-3
MGFLDDNELIVSNLVLLDQALTHRSYANENGVASTNERLEYLGDAVLSLIVSEELYHRFPDYSEGALSRHRSGIVNSKNLVEVAKEVGIDSVLQLGKGEKKSELAPKILEDSFEALLGALFLDIGLAKTRAFIKDVFADFLKTPKNEQVLGSGKSLLQEMMHKKYQSVPIYQLDRTEGPKHQAVFYTCVFHRDLLLGKGQGTSKKASEENGAWDALINHFGLKQHKGN